MKVGIALAAFQPEINVFVKQLLSIQKQSHKDWICIVSFDSPIEKVLTEPALLPFKQDLRFIWTENKIRMGHKKNFETAIQTALQHSVDYIACSDQDDIWYENKLFECVENLKKQPKLSLVHSDMHILHMTRLNEVIAPETAWKLEHRGIHNTRPKHFYIRNIVAGCSMMLDAELVRRYPTIPEDAEYHDWWYALAASYHGGIQGIPQPLYAYRQHDNNEVGVTPYHTMFAVPKGSTAGTLLKKCKTGWLKSYRLACGAQSAGLPLSFLEKIIFLYPFDLGLGLFLMALMNCRKDPPMTRACIARGIGKFLHVIHL